MDSIPNTSLPQRAFDPAPKPGLGLRDFRRICANGFGDGHNAFPHSVAWYKGKLYVGTTRSNFQMLKIQKVFAGLPVHMWPVEGPNDADGLYTLDRRAQIWSYDPVTDHWTEVMRSPMVIGSTGEPVARDTGYRAMVVFQGESDPEPALYVASWAVSRSPGALILRSVDGVHFDPVCDYGIIEGLPITTTRVLVPFKDRLYTSPTGTRGFDVKFTVNLSGTPIIFESRDPARRGWQAVCAPGFGDAGNLGVFVVCPFNDHLYAGVFNLKGMEIWKSDCTGNPPYRWTRVLDRGAGRGPLNQAAASMVVFNNALYVGTGIQNGGFDRANKVGPAGSDLIRIHPDDSWDLLIGTTRETPEGRKIALGGVPAGFGNLFNGYFWHMTVHEGWLYVGTMDSTIWIKYLRADAFPAHVRRFVERIGRDNILTNEAGCDLWRTADGENWLPITRTGFDNYYNLGFRNLVSTPHGLFVASANPFGPRVAVADPQGWHYEDNPRGGLEIWLGSRAQQ
jgi:hypothetical protein